MKWSARNRRCFIQYFILKESAMARCLPFNLTSDKKIKSESKLSMLTIFAAWLRTDVDTFNELQFCELKLTSSTYLYAVSEPPPPTPYWQFSEESN